MKMAGSGHDGQEGDAFMKIYDLRIDTDTRPDAGMRKAMA